jgi:predicted Fe-Mo cluster-binding NifX family protein
MKIIIPSAEQGGLDDGLASHFGRCPVFTVVEVENGKVKDVGVVENPYFEQHMPFAVPGFLATLKPDLVICSGVGPRAIDELERLGIKFIYGCEGKVGEVIDAYLKDKLELKGNVCEHVR